MKRACKRFLSLLLAFVMLFGLFGMAQTVYAMGSLQNVKISSSGILTWNAFPGAKVYNYNLGGSYGGYTSGTSLDLKAICQSHDYAGGSYKVTICAMDDYPYYGGKQISEKWTGTYNYTSTIKQLASPTNLNWIGSIATWYPVTNAVSYDVWLHRDGYSSVQTGTVSSTSVDLKKYLTEGTYNYYFSVVAKASASSGYKDSIRVYSRTVTFTIEFPELKNVKISSDGMMTWDAFSGAKSYYYSVSNYGRQSTTNSADLKAFCKMCGLKSGTYSVNLYALDSYSMADAKRISEIWKGSFYYDASASSYKLGDVDKNGTVNTADALMALKMAVGIIKPTNEQKNIADVDKDGKITTADALAILKYAVGIIKSF